MYIHFRISLFSIRHVYNRSFCQLYINAAGVSALPLLYNTWILSLHTHTSIASVDLHVVLRADTCVITQRVIAGTRAANPREHQTLIGICKCYTRVKAITLNRTSYTYCNYSTERIKIQTGHFTDTWSGLIYMTWRCKKWTLIPAMHSVNKINWLFNASYNHSIHNNPHQLHRYGSYMYTECVRIWRHQGWTYWPTQMRVSTLR